MFLTFTSFGSYTIFQVKPVEVNESVVSEQVVALEHRTCTTSAEERRLNLGKLHFRLRYNYEKHALCVTIVKCADLPPKESNVASTTDPYVKLQLLPDKQHKVSQITRKSNKNFPNPNLNFEPYGLCRALLSVFVLPKSLSAYVEYVRIACL